MEEKKQGNEKFKDFTTEEMVSEIVKRFEMCIVVSEKALVVKGGCDLYRLIGLSQKTTIELTMLLKQTEVKKAQSGIVLAKTKLPPIIQ